MIEFTHTSPEPGATAAIGASIARLLRPGDVLALEGEMGAGKTTLVRAIATGLGIDPRTVSSPTFVIVNQYPIPAKRPEPHEAGPLGGGQLIHVDAYRVAGTDELENAGWDRLFTEDRRAAGLAAAVIEWPGRIAEALPPAPDLAIIHLDHTGPESRRLRCTLPDAWANRTGFELFRERAPIRCAVSLEWVEPMSPSYPFINEQAQHADLYRWFTGGYKTSRGITEKDLDEES